MHYWCLLFVLLYFCVVIIACLKAEHIAIMCVHFLFRSHKADILCQDKILSLFAFAAIYRSESVLYASYERHSYTYENQRLLPNPHSERHCDWPKVFKGALREYRLCEQTNTLANYAAALIIQYACHLYKKISYAQIFYLLNSFYIQKV